MRILAIVGAVLLGAFLIFVGAFGARWLTPEQAQVAPVEISSPTESSPHSRVGSGELDVDAMRELLAVLDVPRRNQILDSAEIFDKFVTQETLNQAVLTAAYANGAEKNDAIRVLMERAGQRVLVDAYLNEVVRLNLDQDFPSDEQVREAYEKNSTVFLVPQRMHLWQIFLPLEANDDGDAGKRVWALADKISADLASGKVSFEAMAKAHSTHEASRLNDGYMGLIKVNELLPAIREAALKLKVDGVSAPIASETGLHIVKRGALVEEELLDFASVKEKIRERLRSEAAQKVRAAAIEKIAEEYPVKPPQGDLEIWRETLRQDGDRPGALPAVEDGR